MATTTLAKAVSDFAQAPNNVAAIVAALKESYEREILEGGHIRDELYPPLPPGDIPKDWRCIGTRYTIEFANGQSVSVVISNATGKPIERTYTDWGDIHADKIMPALRGWVKAIDQAQRGGRAHGMSKTTQERYDRLWQSWQLSRGMTEDQFCDKSKITRRTLDRVIAYHAKKK